MTDLHVAGEFSRYLGGRYRADGEFSGQEFREDFLQPRVASAMGDRVVLHVNFDGVVGLPTSFVEEAFGGLLRANPDWKLSEIVKWMVIEAPESPQLRPFIDLALEFMERSSTPRQRG